MLTSPPFPVNRKDLGAFEKTFATGSFSWVRMAGYFTSGLAFCMAVFFLYLKQQLAPSSEVEGIPEIIAIVLFALSFILFIASMLHKVKRNRVALFENGVAVEAGGKIETASWEEVGHYFNAGMGDPFRFKLKDGAEISISSETAGFTSLCAEIRLRAGEQIFHREYALIRTGGTSQFGPLALRLEGFRLEGLQMDWSDIQRMYSRVTNGHETLTFETSSLLTGLGPSVAASKLPSVHVCYRIIEELAPARLLSTH